MASISTLGIGSGMDLNSLVSQLVALERKPLEQMKVDASKLQTKVSSFGQVQSLFSSLQDASNKLSGTSLWSQTTASSADERALTVSSSNGAATGSYSISVQSLAASQSVVGTSTFANSSELVGSGTLTVEIGSWDAGATSFTPNSGGTPVSITADPGDTLATLRDKINAADAGVIASIVTDASGARLSIRSKETGLENGFRIGVADDDGAGGDASGLSRFAYDPAAGQAQMSLTRAASNAAATINGIEVTSASNTLNNVIEGLNIRLLQVTEADVDVSVVEDKEAITDAVKAFAKAYSDLATYLREQTKYDAGSKNAGPLQGDSTATGLLNRLRAILNTPSGASSTYPRMSDLGLQLQADGTLSVNTTRLSGALDNLPELRKALSNYDTVDAGNNGFAKRYAILAEGLLATDGSLTTRAESLRKRIKDNSVKQDRLNDRVDQFEQRLIAQYTAMDAKLAQFNSLSSYLTQQLASLNFKSGD